ncbi:MAG: hypothetical protein ACI9DO_003562, partial [Reinekea sp.]
MTVSALYVGNRFTTYPVADPQQNRLRQIMFNV